MTEQCKNRIRNDLASLLLAVVLLLAAFAIMLLTVSAAPTEDEPIVVGNELQLLCDIPDAATMPEVLPIGLAHEVEVEPVCLDYGIPEKGTGFKAWMDYRTITDSTSDQWALQQDAWTDEDGLRRWGDEGYYMVAMGTYYAGNRCGKVFDITFDGGDSIRCVIADVKQNRHTDALNQHKDGNVVEFIVDARTLSNTCKVMGDVSYAEHANLTGKPIQISEVLGANVIEE